MAKSTLALSLNEMEDPRTIIGFRARPPLYPGGPIIIAFWIQKGGAAKTTHAVNFAAMMASLGYKTLLIDADSQCDATILLQDSLINTSQEEGELEVDDYNDYLNQGLSAEEKAEGIPRTLFEAVEALRNDKPGGIKAAKSKLVFRWSNKGALWLLPGHRRLSRWDEYISYANGNLDKPHYRKYPGAMYDAILKAAGNLHLPNVSTAQQADFVILDLSATPGPVNCCLYMSSHFTLMPVVPDKLTVHDIGISFETIADWHKTARTYVERTEIDDLYKFPSHFPKFLGYMVGRYDIGGVNARGIAAGRGELGENGIVEDDCVAINVGRLFEMARRKVERCIPSLRQLRPSLLMEDQRRYHLANIRTFNQCGQLAQLLGIPICFLSLNDMAKYNKNGEIQRMIPSEAKIYMERITEFRQIYQALAKNVLTLICSFDPRVVDRSDAPFANLFVPSHILSLRATFVDPNRKQKRPAPPRPSITQPVEESSHSEEVVERVTRARRIIREDN